MPAPPTNGHCGPTWPSTPPARPRAGNQPRRQPAAAAGLPKRRDTAAPAPGGWPRRAWRCIRLRG
eukprot:9934396-Lingulodinium_polyedra.AAC.1